MKRILVASSVLASFGFFIGLLSYQIPSASATQTVQARETTAYTATDRDGNREQVDTSKDK